MIEIHNKTTHDVVILDKNNQEIKRFKTEGTAICLGAEVESVGTLEHIPLTKTRFKETQGLPQYKESVFYIVSQQVKSNLPDRKDLLIPAEVVVRNRTKQVIGCRSLGM
ncbi:MAG: hypothetical protein ACYSTS_03100 [Planctomycetota bacterium]|jgi:hypothetical protein